MRHWTPLLLAALWACGSDEPRRPTADAGAEAGAPDAEAPPDAGREAWHCACEGGQEDCQACLEKIGTCCYDGDATIGGQVDRLAGTCEMNGACAACCNECAAKSCEELVAAGACPPAAQAPWGNGVVLDNGILQELVAVPLTREGLEGQEALQAYLADPGFHKFLSYVVQCALPEGAEVDVGGEVLQGATGLAPEWAEGPCETACQEWVSACMFSRANAYAVTVILYASSPHPAMQVPDEDRDLYTEQEGAFYGNMFVDPPVEYACRGEGRDPLLGTFRVCAQPGNRCGIQWVGACGPVDGDSGEPSERHACEDYDPTSRAYLRCHNRATEAGSGAFPDGTQTYERVMTTWVARSAFQEGYADPCESVAIPPFAPDDVPGGAGSVCDNDDDCATDRGLRCDAQPDRGYCTMACAGSPDPGAERAQCGDDATCLVLAGEEGVCTAECTPHSRGGDCPTGQLCTTLSFWRGTPDDPGCRPFCSTDADCPPQTPCSRLGACGFPVDLDLLADGEPCTFPEGSNIPLVPCRGACFRIDADPSHGLCGSFINTAVTDECPDDPRMPVLTREDDLGLCNYRRCVVDADCTPPLVCSDTRLGLLCDYPR